ncbi:molybdopterin synthase sulfur carrier subunit [Algoriphagus locisalis]|uniref:Molybdopterin synthase sulfur carrier subunit n=1 Tax=Algoriphagus locisalis TaxID=305507 RepID=A0A1I7APY3_9BACT|nr:MoaD/ThiS family protein [Algoriphagus locisalis]SFT76989.1 molybdopterin synthase sulfur carrier subunit [Algoriphagus locisalis]
MITVNYFGNIAEATQSDSETLDQKSMSLEELLNLLDSKYDIRKFQFQVAVNRKIIPKQQVLTISDSDEVALLPPFAGG